MTKFFATTAKQRFFLRLILSAAVLSLPAHLLFAVSCPVVKHGPPSEAELALRTAMYAKAEALYQAEIAKHPNDAELTAGLVHALLGDQKVQQAADAVKAALAATPNVAPLLTLEGEVVLREGNPWDVEPIVLASYKLDPCNPRTRLLYARYQKVNSKYATAQQQILLAHQFDPEDAEIREAWIETLPLTERIAETEKYLSDSADADVAVVGRLKSQLNIWKKLASEPPSACQLVSTAAPADLPFISLLGNAGHVRAFGLDVALNGNSNRMEIGGAEGGLTLYKAAAERAKLRRITASEGGGGPVKPSYLAHADSIKVGSLEFKDCVVKVIDGNSLNDDGDGLIGMDVFSNYLVTVDYPMHKVKLGALPLRSGETAAATASLKTTSASLGDLSPAHSLPVDRVIAPEMKEYSQIYRVGDGLILPAVLNATKVKLFNLDLGAQTTSVAPAVAKEVSKVYEKNLWGQKVLVADEITFNFAHLSQKVNSVVAADTSMESRFAGMEISGTIGANTFSVLTMHIDYRDGLVKFDYIPDRGYTMKP
jgi:hypothetical protein